MELKLVKKPLLIELCENASVYLMRRGIDPHRFAFSYDDRDLTQANFLFLDEHFREKEVAWIRLNGDSIIISELWGTDQWGLERKIDKKDQVNNKRREISLKEREYCKDLNFRMQEYLVKVLGKPSDRNDAWATTEYRIIS